MDLADARHDLTRTTLAVLFIGGLIAALFLVVRPFLGDGMGHRLVIATWPLMLRLQADLGGRRLPAVTLMTLGLLLIVALPLSFAIGSIVVNSDRILVGVIGGLLAFRLRCLFLGSAVLAVAYIRLQSGSPRGMRRTALCRQPM